MTSGTRINELVELSLEQVQAILNPVLAGARISGIERIDEGLINTVFKVRLEHEDLSYAIRVYVGEAWRFERERDILPRLAPTIPVPRVILADASSLLCPKPFFVYPWIEGMTVNECRKLVSTETLLTFAKPLGQVLARIAACPPPAGRSIRFDARVPALTDWLTSGVPRERLGGNLADRLLRGFEDHSARLRECDKSEVLVHGDFSGRNILMKAKDFGGWAVSGILDWEFANLGSQLWDVASLFRYSSRYSPEFRQIFADNYRETGGTLPDDWWWVSRWLDATRLVKIVALLNVVPSVFEDCRDLLESLT